MKRILGIIFFLFLSLQISAQESTSAYSTFYKDSAYYLIGNNVRVRLNPDTSAKVLLQLPIGQPIKILEETEFTYTQDGFTSSWYRVLFNRNGDKDEGYIWGGNIATKTVKSITDKGILFMYGVSKVVKKEYFDELTIQVRVCKEKKELSKIEIKGVGGLNTYNTSEAIGNKGVEGVTDIFKINFSDGFCAGAFGDAYFFWDGTSLYHAKTLDEGYDAPYFDTNNFIFPNDEKGKPGLIINYEETGYQNDNDKIIIESWARTTYKWDGTKLVVVKKQGKKSK